jgi:hypothetical protein
MELDRRQVLEHRIAAQQLDRPSDARRALTDAEIFDLGVQDTGRDGASWALVNRGVPLSHPTDLERADDVGLVWTLRASPHYYRREDLPDVLVATSPWSEADAVKRMVGAGKPLKAAGVSTLDGLAEVAEAMRAVVDRPRSKGEVSSQLTANLPDHHLRECVPCQAVHPWEVPFRSSALYAGLELEPGTSPPVLRRIPGWPRRTPGPAPDPGAAPERLQPIRRYLELQGPATANDVAGFLDAPVTVIKKQWPSDAISIKVAGQERWLIGEPKAPVASVVRLLGPYDLLLQARDRDLLVPDKARHKQLWPVIGRPGAVLVGTDLVGTWRPRASAGAFTLLVEPWTKITKSTQDKIAEQAELLASHRGATLTKIDYAS